MTMRRIRRFASAGVLGAILLLGLGSIGSTALGANHAVDISGFAFAPSTVTVAVGDTVSWTNDDAQNHTATADDASFDTGVVSNGTTKSVTFSTSGTFTYHCRIHSTMTGTVIVEAAAKPPSTDTAMPAEPGSGALPGGALLAVIFALTVALVARRLSARPHVDG
jgi:plastocyanin